MFVAHRGGAGLAPENTMAAFTQAVERWDADMLELDVNTTRDGHVVVIHDETVDRTTDGSGPVSSFDLSDLQRLDAGFDFRDPDDGTFSFRGKGVRVPQLDEVLGAFPRLRINVELKVPSAAQGTLDIIRRHAAENRVLVAAHHEASRRSVDHYTGPWGASAKQLRRYWLTYRIPGIDSRAPTADVFQIPDRWRGRSVATPRLLAAAHAHNIPVHVWVVDEPARMHELLDLGVDGIQTDRPDRLDAVFRERGLR